jgi:peptidoglycan hydrolase-like protein with peptidoglycan-binding domain
MTFFKWFIAVVWMLSFSTSYSQEYYAVQLGIFLNPRISDFDNVQSLGYIYAQEDGAGTYRILVGDFDSPQQAAKVEQQARQNGYMDATIMKRAMTFGKSVVVIQLATRSMQEKVAWENFANIDDLYVLVENNQLKIVTGSYANLDAAKADLQRVRNKGFKDAFPKSLNSARLHKPGTFELGEYKKDLIPLDFTAKQGTPTQIDLKTQEDFRYKGAQEPKNTPSNYAYTASSNEKIVMPNIRNNIKRRSALDLQTVLKELRLYNGSVDGLYGDGTAEAYARAVNTNEQFQKYKLLTQYIGIQGTTGNVVTPPLQVAIDNLWTAPNTSLKTLENSNQPLAKAYRAYWMFQKSGATGAVNKLMNEAITSAFKDVPTANLPPIDPKATYAYYDLETLIRHITYIHQVQKSLSVPCWLPTRHTKEFENATTGNKNIAMGCSSFYDWELVRILEVISRDLSADDKASPSTGELSKLYANPTALNQAEVDGLTAWSDLLWQNIKRWSRADPLHEKIAMPLQIVYFQLQVQLEDHFMDKGFSVPQAKGLAIKVIKALIGDRVERFV